MLFTKGYFPSCIAAEGSERAPSQRPSFPVLIHLPPLHTENNSPAHETKPRLTVLPPVSALKLVESTA